MLIFQTQINKSGPNSVTVGLSLADTETEKALALRIDGPAPNNDVYTVSGWLRWVKQEGSPQLPDHPLMVTVRWVDLHVAGHPTEARAYTGDTIELGEAVRSAINKNSEDSLWLAMMNTWRAYDN